MSFTSVAAALSSGGHRNTYDFTRKGNNSVQVISDFAGPGATPESPSGHTLIASIDVEWSKNYRIKNGNQAFCYSIVWLAVPTASGVTGSTSESFDNLPWWATSVYLDHDTERHQLIEAAATDLAAAADSADLIVGHQLYSDLAVLAANAGANPPPAIAAAQLAWRNRRIPAGLGACFLDTRFDAGHLLAGRSRRLVDVCTELDLDVTQPELARKSMTALHRDWLSRADTEARERITLLNLRHSLSTAYVAARAAGHLTWPRNHNVNASLADHLTGRLAWIGHPTFQALIKRSTR